ncbi:MAG: nuclear transport factor 2 family protein [Acidimicrobiales bacterium]
MGMTGQDSAADINEIIMLTHRYAKAVDKYDPEALLTVFAEDAVLDHSPYGNACSEGHDEISAYFARLKASGRPSMHITSNHTVEIVDADEAVGTSYVQAMRPGTEAGSPIVAALAMNEDRYVRTDAGWRISHRRTSPLIDVGI